MSLFARTMYKALVWKERQRARREKPPARTEGPEHLVTGERGETLAYWFLRQAGYTIVARNRRARGGELDLIAWDGPVLAFVEVKTRTSGTLARPEDAVTREKQRRIARAARQYLRRIRKKPEAHRFDIVSVFWDAQSGLQVRLTKDAFKP
jgi:putative endonuclease